MINPTWKDRHRVAKRLYPSNGPTAPCASLVEHELLDADCLCRYPRSMGRSLPLLGESCFVAGVAY
jgi:hypothetical protein